MGVLKSPGVYPNLSRPSPTARLETDGTASVSRKAMYVDR